MDRTIEATLQKLARLQDTEYPFITLYLDTKWDDPKKRKQDDIFLKNSLKQAEADPRMADETFRKAFMVDAKAIHTFLERDMADESDGVAIFSCTGAGVFESIELPDPFVNSFHMSSRPMLRQLAVLLSEYEPVLIALVDTRHARLLEVVVGDLVSEHDIDNEVHGRIHSGGWSQMRYQRHIIDQRDHHHKEVAEAIARLSDREGYGRIILEGQDKNLASLKRHLPKRTLGKVIAEGHLNIDNPQDKILKHALDLLHKSERMEETEFIQHLMDQSLSGGLGALGIEPVLEALRLGNVHTLVFDDEFEKMGFKCGTCHALLLEYRPGRPTSCTFCGSVLERVPLDEAMIQAAIAQHAQVHKIEDQNALDDHENVGALLRFRE